MQHREVAENDHIHATKQNKLKKATQYVVCYKVSPHTHVLGTWCSGDDAIWGGCGNLRSRSLAGGGGYLGLCL